MPRLDGPGDPAALWSALVPLLVVLAQAGIYWLLTLAWAEKAPMPVTVAGVYRAFRIIDAVLLGAGLVGILVWWSEQPGTVAAQQGPVHPRGVGLVGQGPHRRGPGPPATGSRDVQGVWHGLEHG